MNNTDFSYVMYVAATPEQVWDALMKPELSRQFWNHENHSDWKAGSIWEHRDVRDNGAVAMTGLVIKHEPPRHLLLTWASPKDAANLSSHSRVAIDLEPVDGMTRVVLRHDQLVPASAMRRDMEEGWPRILSSLKSFLETGQPLASSRPEPRAPMADERFSDDARAREDARVREARLAEAQRVMDSRDARRADGRAAR